MDLNDFYQNYDISYLFCEIIASIQELERKIREARNESKNEFNNDKYISNKDCIDELSNVFNEKKCNTLKKIINLRNYLMHNCFIDKELIIKTMHINEYYFTGETLKDLKLLKSIVFEAHDFIDNYLSNNIRPNIIDENYKL